MRRGFTLVEVLVALVIMAVIAVMGWQGVDSMARSRDIGQAASERALRLSTVVAQWEQDLGAVYDSPQVPGLAFDGASLRLVRRSDGGVQVVVWSVQPAPGRRVAVLQSARGQADEAEVDIRFATGPGFGAGQFEAYRQPVGAGLGAAGFEQGGQAQRFTLEPIFAAIAQRQAGHARHHGDQHQHQQQFDQREAGRGARGLDDRLTARSRCRRSCRHRRPGRRRRG